MVRTLLFSIIFSILLIANETSETNQTSISDLNLSDLNLSDLNLSDLNLSDLNLSDTNTGVISDILGNVTLEGNETIGNIINELNNTTDFVKDLTNELQSYVKPIDDIVNEFKGSVSDITDALDGIKDILETKGLPDEINDTTSKEKETYDEYVKVNNLKLYDISSTILMQQKIPPATFELKKLQKEEYYK